MELLSAAADQMYNFISLMVGKYFVSTVLSDPDSAVPDDDL
jgi:hypothetical protein